MATSASQLIRGKKGLYFVELVNRLSKKKMEWPFLNFTFCNLLLTSNLVSHSLGLNDSNIIKDSLVEMEVLGQSRTKVSSK